MKLFLMTQDEVVGYDYYDSVVVAAESEDDARTIHPYARVTLIDNNKWMISPSFGWCTPEEYISDEWPEHSNIKCVNVEYLGETDKPRGVILASFNAG